MTKTIATAQPLKNGDISIFVEAESAASLHAFLKRKGVSCTPPQGAIFRPIRVTVDGMGRKQVEYDVLESEIVAQGSAQDFERWMGEWVTGR